MASDAHCRRCAGGAAEPMRTACAFAADVVVAPISRPAFVCSVSPYPGVAAAPRCRSTHAPATGIDDHSRFVVCATVLATPSVRKVAEALIAAMRRIGVPSEVLSDNGIKQRLTKPRSPTTTGKIER